MEPMHAYSPEQYARTAEVWRRLVDLSGRRDLSDEDLYTAILSDGDVEGWRRNELELSFSYSSDHAGSDFDRANARYLAENYPFLTHLDNDGVWSESCVTTQLGELPGADIDDAIESLEGLASDLEYAREEYPILCESTHSELEEELREEAWDAYLRSDVMNEVATCLGCDTFDLEEDFKFSEDEIREMFYETYFNGHREVITESATSVVFTDDEEACQEIADEIVKVWRTVVPDPNQLSLV